MIKPTVNKLRDGGLLIASSYDHVMFTTTLYGDGTIDKGFIAPSYKQDMTVDRLLNQFIHNAVHDEIVLRVLNASVI